MPDSSTKKRKPRGSLSKPIILKAAQDLLHSDGIDALSIRKIANQLGAGPMSIYNHYPTKQDIEQDLVADFVQRAHSNSADSSDWRTWLSHTFMNIYSATIKEPEYLTLMINSKNIGIASINIFEDSLSCLIKAGFSPKHAATVFHQLLSFTLGAAMLNANLSKLAPSNEPTTTTPETADHPVDAQQWQHAHHIMLGNEFETSLQTQIGFMQP